MEIDRGLINLLIVILIGVVGLVRWLLHRRAQAQGQRPAGPPPEEPKLPLEDMVDRVFGPYMERRRRQYQEARGREDEDVEIIEVIEEPEPPPRRPAPKPTPAPPALVPVARVSRELPAAPAPVSLEDQLFRNPRWGTGARLVVAAEILGRPKFLRRPAGGPFDRP